MTQRAEHVSTTVTPETFHYVSFDAELIRRIAERLASAIGLDGHPIAVEVDETTPLARVRVDVGDTITVHAESGAFEDMRVPRQQSESATATAIGRMLLRAYDRLHGGFADAPADPELTLAQSAAWDTSCVGRLERLGVPMHQQRWRYNFRNRHGFHDASDAAFDQLWSAETMTWDELTAISARGSTSPPIPPTAPPAGSRAAAGHPA